MYSHNFVERKGVSMKKKTIIEDTNKNINELGVADEHEETYQDILVQIDEEKEAAKDEDIFSEYEKDFGGENPDRSYTNPENDLTSENISDNTESLEIPDEIVPHLAEETDITPTMDNKKSKSKKVKEAKKVKTDKSSKKKDKKLKDKNLQKTKLIHSINIKMAFMVFLSVLLALVVTFFVTMSGFESGIDSLVRTNMVTAVSTYNTLLEDTILLTKNNLTTSNLTSLYKNEGLSGVESSHVSLVNEEGNYTYNIDHTLIGEKVVYEEIIELVKKHRENPKEEIEPDVLEISDGEKSYYIGYYACDNGWLLLCTADKDELYQTYDEVRKTTLIGAAVILVIFAAFGFLVSNSITKPIKKLTSVIHKTASLDFRPNPVLDKLCKVKDETGEMSRALYNMQLSVKDVITKINLTSDIINSNSLSLKDLADLVNANSTDNSATTEEIAAGMQETAASTTRVDENINNILLSIDNISNKTKDGQDLAVKIMNKASKLKTDTILASDNGKEMFANVRKETSVAIEKSKDVDKINSLTKTILDISDQTSLLSINASIEAARAGEAGRGFAVVAEQIGHLAYLSAATVENIGTIVEDVNNAVNSMAECLETTLNFLEEKVLEDYSGFISVSDEYNSDADLFEKSMKEIYKSITELESSTTLIADAISGINNTINDSSVGVSNIAEKTSDIVSLTIRTNEMVDESVQNAKELNNIVEVFKL